MPIVFIVNRTDSRGTNPVKFFMLKESAQFFIGECNTALKLICLSDDPVEEFSLLKQFDSDAIMCDSINYEVEEIQSE